MTRWCQRCCAKCTLTVFSVRSTSTQRGGENPGRGETRPTSPRPRRSSPLSSALWRREEESGEHSLHEAPPQKTRSALASVSAWEPNPLSVFNSNNWGNRPGTPSIGDSSCLACCVARERAGSSSASRCNLGPRRGRRQPWGGGHAGLAFRTDAKLPFFGRCGGRSDAATAPALPPSSS